MAGLPAGIGYSVMLAKRPVIPDSQNAVSPRDGPPLMVRSHEPSRVSTPLEDSE